MRRVLPLLVLLVGCEAPSSGQPAPLPLYVVTSTTVQAALPSDAPLRLSLSFRGSAGIDTSTVVFDAPFVPPLTTLEVGGGPAPALTEQLVDGSAYLGNVDGDPWLVVRFTDLVLYADTDRDGAWSAVDRPLSVRAAVAFVPQIDVQLAELSLAAARAYYEATEDRVSSYLRIMTLGGTTIVLDHRVPIDLDVVPEVFVRTEVSCPVMPPSPVPLAPARTRAVRVARDLDAEAICGLEVADCRPLELTAPPPDIDPRPPSVDSTRVRACRRNTTLEALVIEDRTARCRDCACGWAIDVRTFVVGTSSTPPWWPCGREDTPYCDAPGSLRDIPGECRE